VISEAMAKIADLLIARKLPMPLRDHYKGVCSIKIDDTWSVAVNGHDTEKDGVPAFHASIEYNGWPAGIVGVHGGIVCAGECANENTLIAALDAAIASASTVAEKGEG